MPTTRRENPVTARLSRYVDLMFEHLADRIAPKVADRLAIEMETLAILNDSETMDDLKRASAQPDEDARPYEEVRRSLGLA